MSQRNNSFRQNAPDATRRQILTGLGALGATAVLSGCDRVATSDTAKSVVSTTQELTQAAQRLVSSRESLAPEFDASQIAPNFRGNGTTDPQESAYRALAANGFADWQLAVGGLVERPGKFSLAALKAMPARTQITRHDCVEGWSCIGQWTGVQLTHVLAAVRPRENARYVVFHCADHVYGAATPYYESLDMVEAHHPQTILAYGLNGHTLPITNGAPLRLRAERQLGYKQAKYLMQIELVDSFRNIQGGHGGWWEDRGYQWWAGI